MAELAHPVAVCLGVIALHACAAARPHAEEAPAPSAASAASSGSCDATGGEPTKDTPTKEDVMEAMSLLKDAIASCNFSGVAEVSFTFVSSGCLEDLPSVKLGGGQTDEVAQCVKRAASLAKLPPFREAKFKVLFPFKS